MTQVIVLIGSVNDLSVKAIRDDGTDFMIVAKIRNEAGVKRVLKSHAKFYGMLLSNDGLSAQLPDEDDDCE